MALSSNTITKIVVFAAIAAILGGFTFYYFRAGHRGDVLRTLKRGAEDYYKKHDLDTTLDGPELAPANHVRRPLVPLRVFPGYDRSDPHLESFHEYLFDLLDSDRRAEGYDDVGTIVITDEQDDEYTSGGIPYAATLVLVDASSGTVVGRKRFTGPHHGSAVMLTKMSDYETAFWKPVAAYVNDLP